jgi:hypothetical protein
MSFGAEAPVAYSAIPPSDREARTVLTPDQCIVDYERFFVRGRLEIPVAGRDDRFLWLVWVEVGFAEYERMNELWTVAGREAEPPYPGSLATDLTVYPSTLELAVELRTRPVGERPLVRVVDGDHPLAVEQRTGITIERVQQIGERILHAGGPALPRLPRASSFEELL